MNPRIKHALIDAGKSSTDLAAHLGISRSHLSNLIADRRKMKLEHIKRIAKFLKTDPDYLLGLK